MTTGRGVPLRVWSGVVGVSGKFSSVIDVAVVYCDARRRLLGMFRSGRKANRPAMIRGNRPGSMSLGKK